MEVGSWGTPALDFGLWTLDSDASHVSTSCWKFSCDFKSGATMTTGRSGKSCCNSAAKNGRADGQTPAQDSAPPCSSRRARDCTAGACVMSANQLPAADAAAFCAKQRKVCSGKRLRQAAFSTSLSAPPIICSSKHRRAAGCRCADKFPGLCLLVCRKQRRLCPKKNVMASASSPPPIQPWCNWSCNHSTT